MNAAVIRVNQKEAMRMVGIKDPHAFNDWVRQMKVPHCFQGKSKMFRLKTLERYCEKQEAEHSKKIYQEGPL